MTSKKNREKDWTTAIRKEHRMMADKARVLCSPHTNLEDDINVVTERVSIEER